MRNSHITLCAAFTLIEILITIVVVSIAGTALLSVYTNLTRQSADPIIQQQAIAIAEAYMEEIRLKPFLDPDGGTETRANFDNVGDYDSLVDAGARDQNDIPIAGLDAYTVSVDVLSATIANITDVSGNALRIDVTVNHPAIGPIVLSSFRTNI